MWGWGIPSVHKRAATPIPAQTTRGTKVEESQGEHGVEVRVRECMRHVNVAKVPHMRHETQCVQADEAEDCRESKAKLKRQAQISERKKIFQLATLWILVISGLVKNYSPINFNE